MRLFELKVVQYSSGSKTLEESAVFLAHHPRPEKLKVVGGDIELRVRGRKETSLLRNANISALSSVLVSFDFLKSRWSGSDTLAGGLPLWSTFPQQCKLLYTREAAHLARKEFLELIQREGFNYDMRRTSGEIEALPFDGSIADFLQSGFALIAERRKLGTTWYSVVVMAPAEIGSSWTCRYYVGGLFKYAYGVNPSVALFNALDDIGYIVRLEWNEWSMDPITLPSYVDIRTPRELGQDFYQLCLTRWNEIALAQAQKREREILDWFRKPTRSTPTAE